MKKCPLCKEPFTTERFLQQHVLHSQDKEHRELAAFFGLLKKDTTSELTPRQLAKAFLTESIIKELKSELRKRKQSAICETGKFILKWGGFEKWCEFIAFAARYHSGLKWEINKTKHRLFRNMILGGKGAGKDIRIKSRAELENMRRIYEHHVSKDMLTDGAILDSIEIQTLLDQTDRLNLLAHIFPHEIPQTGLITRLLQLVKEAERAVSYESTEFLWKEETRLFSTVLSSEEVLRSLQGGSHALLPAAIHRLQSNLDVSLHKLTYYSFGEAAIFAGFVVGYHFFRQKTLYLAQLAFEACHSLAKELRNSRLRSLAQRNKSCTKKCRSMVRSSEYYHGSMKSSSELIVDSISELWKTRISGIFEDELELYEEAPEAPEPTPEGARVAEPPLGVPLGTAIKKRKTKAEKAIQIKVANYTVPGKTVRIRVECRFEYDGKKMIMEVDGKSAPFSNCIEVYEVFQTVGEHSILVKDLDNNQTVCSRRITCRPVLDLESCSESKDPILSCETSLGYELILEKVEPEIFPSSSVVIRSTSERNWILEFPKDASGRFSLTLNLEKDSEVWEYKRTIKLMPWLDEQPVELALGVEQSFQLSFDNSATIEILPSEPQNPWLTTRLIRGSLTIKARKAGIFEKKLRLTSKNDKRVATEKALYIVVDSPLQIIPKRVHTEFYMISCEGDWSKVALACLSIEFPDNSVRYWNIFDEKPTIELRTTMGGVYTAILTGSNGELVYDERTFNVRQFSTPKGVSPQVETKKTLFLGSDLELHFTNLQINKRIDKLTAELTRAAPFPRQDFFSKFDNIEQLQELVKNRICTFFGPGSYRLELILNGQKLGRAEFEILDAFLVGPPFTAEHSLVVHAHPELNLKVEPELDLSRVPRNPNNPYEIRVPLPEESRKTLHLRLDDQHLALSECSLPPYYRTQSTWALNYPEIVEKIENMRTIVVQAIRDIPDTPRGEKTDENSESVLQRRIIFIPLRELDASTCSSLLPAILEFAMRNTNLLVGLFSFPSWHSSSAFEKSNAAIAALRKVQSSVRRFFRPLMLQCSWQSDEMSQFGMDSREIVAFGPIPCPECSGDLLTLQEEDLDAITFRCAECKREIRNICITLEDLHRQLSLVIASEEFRDYLPKRFPGLFDQNSLACPKCRIRSSTQGVFGNYGKLEWSLDKLRSRKGFRRKLRSIESKIAVFDDHFEYLKKREVYESKNGGMAPELPKVTSPDNFRTEEPLTLCYLLIFWSKITSLLPVRLLMSAQSVFRRILLSFSPNMLQSFRNRERLSTEIIETKISQRIPTRTYIRKVSNQLRSKKTERLKLLETYLRKIGQGSDGLRSTLRAMEKKQLIPWQGLLKENGQLFTEKQIERLLKCPHCSQKLVEEHWEIEVCN